MHMLSPSGNDQVIILTGLKIPINRFMVSLFLIHDYANATGAEYHETCVNWGKFECLWESICRLIWECDCHNCSLCVTPSFHYYTTLKFMSSMYVLLARIVRGSSSCTCNHFRFAGRAGGCQFSVEREEHIENNMPDVSAVSTWASDASTPSSCERA